MAHGPGLRRRTDGDDGRVLPGAADPSGDARSARLRSSGHLRGFTYVVLAEQFRGSLVDPLGDLGGKLDTVFDLISGWLGPVGIHGRDRLRDQPDPASALCPAQRARGLVTCFFAASYANADIERYYLVPLFLAFTWVGLGLADALDLFVWMLPREWVAPDRLDDEAAPAETAQTAEEPAATDPDSAEADSESAGSAPSPFLDRPRDPAAGVDGGDRAAGRRSERGAGAAARRRKTRSIRAPSARPPPRPTRHGSGQCWRRPTRAACRPNAVIVSWWSDSTTLWYGQKVEGLRPDIYIVDDRTRLDDNLGEVWDVVDRFLGKRPVFLDRLSFGPDGMLGVEPDIRSQGLTRWRRTGE